MKIVLVTGGFDPLHSGHIDYFTESKALGDRLVVGLNSDAWLARKKGKPFMPFNERRNVIQSLKMVDGTVEFNDSDNTSIHAIEKVKLNYPNDQIIFANGGDRTAGNIPEISVSNVLFKFGVGGKDKKNSSSWILQEWTATKTDRDWGFWKVLSEIDKSIKIKELVVEPGKILSMQRHQTRNEFWFVAKGSGRVHWEHGQTDIRELDTLTVQANEWHQLENIGLTALHVVEIQHGSNCVEQDIERK
jgi:cytidyltransferase-like protein